jgi:hypothetical protein
MVAGEALILLAIGRLPRHDLSAGFNKVWKEYNL